MKFIYIIIILVLMSSCISIQRKIQKGNMAYALGDYAKAANIYKKVYKSIPMKERELRGELSLKMAKSYINYGYATKALTAYENALRYKIKDSTLYLNMAKIERILGRYAFAFNLYKKGLNQYPNNISAQLGLISSQLAIKEMKAGSAYTIKRMDIFNSSRSDYCPMIYPHNNNIVYFTSTRKQSKGNISDITDLKPGDIYVAKKNQKEKWEQPKAIDGDINTNYDEGACCFNREGTVMFLTICRTDSRYPRMAEIWVSKRLNARWEKPTLLKITSDTLSSYAHPALSPNGKYLYFTSDLPGGYGGLDIWRALYNNGKLGAVENLGPEINTKGNEEFPSFKQNGELYFASDGHTPNYGGLDIYRAKEDTTKHVWVVKHLPFPMNSYGDDFGITFLENQNRGFFSTTRDSKGRGWAKIYSFNYPDYLQTVKGWVYEQDGYELPKAQINMIGSDGSNKIINVLSDGSFIEPVKAGVHYIFLASCKGFLNVRRNLFPQVSNKEKQYVLQFPLPSITLPVVIKNIFYEFNKAVITDNSKTALNQLIETLKENPLINIELSAHCDYLGSNKYNDQLSQKRADNIKSYLVQHGISSKRIVAKGYGKRKPKIVSRKMVELYPFLRVGDTLSYMVIQQYNKTEQDICNALNRRTEFKVLNPYPKVQLNKVNNSDIKIYNFDKSEKRKSNNSQQY